MILSGSRFLRSLVRPCQRYNYKVTSCTTVESISTTSAMLDADYLGHIRNIIAVDEAEEVMWVSKRMGGVVVGKGGATLRDIMGRTNAAIEVDFEGVKDGEVPVRLQGSHDECAEAREIIDQLLQKDTDTNMRLTEGLMKDGLVPFKTISGEPEKCAEAKAMIEQLLHSSTTVWVPKDRLGLIIGKGGAKITSLKKDTGTNISLNRDLMKDGLVPCSIIGEPEKCVEAKAIIEQLLFAGSETTVWVPKGRLGLIIGKGGAKIASLRKDTGTTMFLTEDLMKDGLVPLTIRGEPEKLVEAKAIIEQLLFAISETTVWVPKDYLALIIGKGGAKITSLCKDTGTDIDLNRDLMKDGLVPLTISGEPEKCAEAKEIIENLLSETTVWVPEEITGLIIGKGGAKIASLQKDTGTNIDVNRDLMKDGLVPLIISGEPEKCAEAKAIIEQLLHHSTTVWVPKDRLGLIIGMGGAKITSLKKDTGTNIDVNRDLMKDGLVPCSIIGEPEKCAEAKAIIEQLLFFLLVQKLQYR